MKLSDSQTAVIAISVPVAESRRVVLLDVGGRKEISEDDYNRNIYCLDTNDEVVWQVSAPKPKLTRDSFVSLKSKDGSLFANRFFGSEWVIDPKSGTALQTGWHK